MIQSPDRCGIVELPVPAPAAGEVLVRSRFAGVCGTDVELWKGLVHEEMMAYPCIPGHEWSGTVESVGSGAGDLRPGDPVVVEGVQHCGRCRFCRQGDTNLCAHKTELGFTRPGGLSEYVVCSARTVHRLREGVPLDHAALIEPTAVVARGIRRARPEPGLCAAVIGPGTIGLLATSLLRLYSPRRLFLLGLTDASLALGARLGATDTVQLRDPDALARVMEETDGLGVDLAVECAGQTSAVDTAFRVVRRGGKVVLMGAAGREAKMEMMSDLFHARDLEVHGVLSYNQATWQDAVRLISDGMVPAGEIIQRRFAFGQAAEALAFLAGGTGVGKSLIHIADG